MTDQTPTETPASDESAPQAASWPPPSSPLYAPPFDASAALSRIEQTRRDLLDEGRKIEKAWASDATAKIRDVVREDGNVDFPEFVKHCGGILNVVTMVDEYGLPDTDQIIPKVDELFNKWAQAEIDSGSVFRRRPGNRPYVAGRGTAAGEARAAQQRGDRDAREGDAETLLRQEAKDRSRTMNAYRSR